MEEEADEPAQREQPQTPVAEEEEDWDAASENLAGSKEDIDDLLFDKDGQLTPIDDLSLPEDVYLLGYEFTDEQAERMLMSPPRTPAEDFAFIELSADTRAPPQPSKPAMEGALPQLEVVKLNYQMRPKGTYLMEPLLTQPYVWVHYKVNKHPVPEWRVELSQLQTTEVKEFQAWFL